MAEHKVVFNPFGVMVTVEAGTTLLDAAAKARISLDSPCGGDGVCGRCKMIVKSGQIAADVTGLLTRDEIREGCVLACQTFVQGDLVVEIPEKTRARERITIDKDAQRFRAEHPNVATREFARDPLVSKVFLKLSKPTVYDNLSDCERLQTLIERETGISSMQTGLKIIQRLPGILRENDFAVTATIGRRRDVSEIMDIEGGDTSAKNFVAVADIGTTTIVVHLVDAVNGETVDAQACFSSQTTYGREVTARMIAAERDGAKRLQELLAGDINRLISSLCQKNNISLGDVHAIFCAGNTAVTHFLLGLPTNYIRREPFVDVTKEPPPFRAAELGLKIHPRGLLFAAPGIGGWVGGDITAGILATGLDELDEISMLIDVGTNGEIVIGNKEWLMACSASAGPALEGSSVECGMMAERGAIEAVQIENGNVTYTTIGGGPPEGLCGSGIIDLVAVLLEIGAIDRSGTFIDRGLSDVHFTDGLGRYVLAEKTGGEGGREIYISQEDINNVVTAKAAIFAAVKIMLDRVGLTFSDIDKLFLAGGFGSRINVTNAIAIGLLPDLPLSDIQYVGNTSIWGAKLAALSCEAYEHLRSIGRRTTCYDLMGSNDYIEQFQQARFLPHTNIELFPSLTRRQTT